MIISFTLIIADKENHQTLKNKNQHKARYLFDSALLISQTINHITLNQNLLNQTLDSLETIFNIFKINVKR